MKTVDEVGFDDMPFESVLFTLAHCVHIMFPVLVNWGTSAVSQRPDAPEMLTHDSSWLEVQKPVGKADVSGYCRDQ